MDRHHHENCFTHIQKSTFYHEILCIVIPNIFSTYIYLLIAYNTYICQSCKYYKILLKEKYKIEQTQNSMTSVNRSTAMLGSKDKILVTNTELVRQADLGDTGRDP